MSWRQVACLWLIVALVVLVPVTWLLWPEPVSRWTAQRIKPGMTAAQVEDLVGRQTDEIYFFSEFFSNPDRGPLTRYVWIGRNGSLGVLFDPKGEALDAAYSDNLERITFRGRVRSWFGL